MSLSKYQLVRVGRPRTDCEQQVNWLIEGTTSLGRNPACDICVKSKFASRDHCKFVVHKDYITVQCSETFNGTFVNQREILGTRRLRVNDFIGIGSSVVDSKTINGDVNILAYQVRMHNADEVLEISDSEDAVTVIELDSDDELPLTNDTRLELNDGNPRMSVSPTISASSYSSKEPTPPIASVDHVVAINAVADNTVAENVVADETVIHSTAVAGEPIISSDDRLADTNNNDNVVEIPDDVIKIENDGDDDDDNMYDVDRWINRLSQYADSGYRKYSTIVVLSESDDDSSAAPATVRMVADPPTMTDCIVLIPCEDRAICDRVEPLSIAMPSTSKVGAGEISKKTELKRRIGAIEHVAGNASDELAKPQLKRRQTDGNQSIGAAPSDEPMPTIIAQIAPPAAATATEDADTRFVDDAPPPPPAAATATVRTVEDADTRFKRIVSRRSSVVERTIQVIEAKPMPSRRSSVCCREPKKPKTVSEPVDTKTRRQKLQEVAELERKPVKPVVRVPTKPKVKITQNNRSAFLADMAMQPPKPAELKKQVTAKLAAAATAAKSKAAKMPFLEDVVEHEQQRLLAPMPTVKPKTYHARISPSKAAVASSNFLIAPQRPTERLPATVVTAEQLEAAFGAYVPPTIKRPNSSAPPAGLTSILCTHGRTRRPNNIRFADPLESIRYIENREDIAERAAQEAQQQKSADADLHCTEAGAAIEADARMDDVATVALIETVRDVRSLASAQRQRSMQRIRDPPSNPINSIVDDITGWKADWLDRMTDEPHVNGANYVPVPMLHNYSGFEMYLDNMLPIMKIELWQTIANEFEARRDSAPFDIIVTKAYSDFQNKHLRYFFSCESTTSEGLSDDDLLLVSYSQKTIVYKFLAIVSNRRLYSTNQQNQTITLFTMVTSNVTANALRPETPTIRAQTVSQLKVELALFDSLLRLDTSPLLPAILRPCDFPVRHMDMDKLPYELKQMEPVNDEQKLIINQICYRWAQKEDTFTLVDGPPGTGKSRLITSLLMQFVYGTMPNRPRRLLLCAHSNNAVDTVCRRLLELRADLQAKFISGDSASAPFSVVRYGLLDRMHPTVRAVSLDVLARSGRSVPQLMDEKRVLKLKVATKRFVPNDSVQRTQDKQYFADRINLVDRAIERTNERMKKNSNPKMASIQADFEYILGSANIICTTLTSCRTLAKYINKLDICVVDEATQCTEPSTLLPLQLGVRAMVLVGDTRQLPGTVLSPSAARLGLKTSLFERIQGAFTDPDACPVFRLCRQYRMNAEICSWPNRYFYGGRLISDPITDRMATYFPLLPYTIFSLGYRHDEQRLPQHQLYNASEAEFVVRLVGMIEHCIGHKNYSVGILTPYARQKSELSDLLRETRLKNLTIETIDAYQGQERDIVIVSNTRSQGIGFLGMSERLNVALTRAKRCLIMCGNFGSLQQHDVWNALLDDAHQRGRLKRLDHIENEMSFRRRIIGDLVKPNFRSRFDQLEY